MTPPSPPGLPEEDYEAIEAAVMETARGRWFLMEFARRNRNADTKVLLEAISRLENQMTGKHAPTTPHQPVSTTTVVSSASSELFAVEPLPVPAAQSLPALPEPAELTWVDEPEIDMDRPVEPDIFHLDDDLILPTEGPFAAPAPAPPVARLSAPAPAAIPAPRAPESPPKSGLSDFGRSEPKSGLSDFGKTELKPATADLRAPALAAPRPVEPRPAESRSPEPRFAEQKLAEPKPEASQPAAQSRMLAGALAQAEEVMARASEAAPPPPPSAFSPAPADPTELDALSFEEKSVYFG
jgi:hypothetical protein